MAFWHAPGAPKATPEQMASFGMPEMAVLHAEAACNRMISSVKELGRRRAIGLGGRESWCLNNMVVGAAHRGAGVETRFLRQWFEQVVDPSRLSDNPETPKCDVLSTARICGDGRQPRMCRRG